MPAQRKGHVMLLITGATGNVGRPLIDRLTAEGASVRAVTRDPQAADLPSGVDVVRGNPSRPETIEAALRGVTGLFVNPRSVGTAIDELLAVAREQGVRRVVALTANNTDDDPAEQPSRYNGDLNREVDAAVTRCALEWTSLRPSFFATNVLGLWTAQIQAGDVIRGPYPRATEAPIDPRDIADVAAHALLTDKLVGQRPELTGPESLSYEQMATIVGDRIGRPLRYKEVPVAAARQAVVGRGFTEQFADAYLTRLAKTVNRPTITTDDVEKILGRPATTFAEWAAGRTGHRQP
ncbi:MAG TPA: NAD(P)H-binding protein [Pseudonocardiaceae bacterium]|nr:NAD(P)H-binding protein [Pseudonocardiaceae bacterium]